MMEKVDWNDLVKITVAVVGAVISITAIVLLALAMKAHAECPPQWKCNGSPQTNDPDCKCWDAR